MPPVSADDPSHPHRPPVTLRTGEPAPTMNLERIIDRARALYPLHAPDIAAMRIAILTPRVVKEMGAGSWKQAECTVAAMRTLGLNVDHRLLAEGMNPDLSEYDVLHVMPFHLGDELEGARLRADALLVASTVVWDSWRHRWLAYPEGRPRVEAVARFALTRALVAAARIPGGQALMPQRLTRLYRRFQKADLLLPNSFAEAAGVRAQFLIPSHTAIEPAPNGVDPFPPHAGQSPLPPQLPQKDFVLYPGLFAVRKNQLGFIQAMRKVELPVVFMGGPLSEKEPEYYDACRKIAPPHHHFLGRVPHRSELFCALMRQARVACLASSCETPGLAALEAAALGARIAITEEGGPREYLGERAEYFSPIRGSQIRKAILRAWERGRDDTQHLHLERYFSWEAVAQTTAVAYLRHLNRKRGLPMPGGQ